MDHTHISKYAQLLTTYCCQIKQGDRVLIRSTYLAESLILACQKETLLKGATCEIEIGLPGFGKQKYQYSSEDALQQIPLLYEHAVKSFDVLIAIHAPFDIHELKEVDQDRLAIAQSALKPVRTHQMQRGKTGELRWVICNYPTESLADAANMSLPDYTTFITQGCFLHHHDPESAWLELSVNQERWVNLLDTGSQIQFKSDHVDLEFSLQGRTWINSDGRRNMPSGEVFTSPVEDSANGTIYFTHPSLVFGEVINDLKLTLKDGIVTDWASSSGQPLLDRLFSIDGANKIGEIAIGTNDAIKKPTLNTLFDEKIGGTIHMAVGASYPETGGKNESSIHHDFVTSFNSNSSIYLDGSLIYKNGKFTV